MYKNVVAHTFNRLGRCYFQEGLFHEAFAQHEAAVQLTRDMTEQEISNTNIATYLKNMGKCMFEIGRWNAANDLFSKAANIWKESEDQSFLPNIDICNDYMRRCILFLGNSQTHGERFVQRSHSRCVTPQIVIDHCEEYEVGETEANDFQCGSGSIARFSDSSLGFNLRQEGSKRSNFLALSLTRNDERCSISQASDSLYKDVATEHLIMLKPASPQPLFDTNQPTYTIVQRNPGRINNKTCCRHCIISWAAYCWRSSQKCLRKVRGMRWSHCRVQCIATRYIWGEIVTISWIYWLDLYTCHYIIATCKWTTLGDRRNPVLSILSTPQS